MSPPVSTTAPPTPPDDRPPVISTAPPKHFWVQPPITARYSASVTSVVPHRYVVTSAAVQSLVHPCSTASYIATLMVSPVHSYTCRSQSSIPAACPPSIRTTPPLPPVVFVPDPAATFTLPPGAFAALVGPAVTVTFPPDPTSPQSTKTATFPARPFVALPVPNIRSPASPWLAGPANTRAVPPVESTPVPATTDTFPADAPNPRAPRIESAPAVSLDTGSCLCTTNSLGAGTPSAIWPLMDTVSVSASPSMTSCATESADSKFPAPVTVIAFSSKKAPSSFCSSASASASRNPRHGCFPVNIFVFARSLNVAVVAPYTPT